MPMTPESLRAQLKRAGPAPAYLFLGPELYGRDECRRALAQRLLPEEDRESGLVRHNLDETSLAAVLDDAVSR